MKEYIQQVLLLLAAIGFGIACYQTSSVMAGVAALVCLIGAIIVRTEITVTRITKEELELESLITTTDCDQYITLGPREA